MLMGYNKNVCKYVSKVREYATANPGTHVTFVSNNTYSPNAESLGEVRLDEGRSDELRTLALGTKITHSPTFVQGAPPP